MTPQPIPGTDLLGHRVAAACLPYCLRVLAENVQRHIGRNGVGEGDLRRLLAWTPGQPDII